MPSGRACRIAIFAAARRTSGAPPCPLFRALGQELEKSAYIKRRIKRKVQREEEHYNDTAERRSQSGECAQNRSRCMPVRQPAVLYVIRDFAGPLASVNPGQQLLPCCGKALFQDVAFIAESRNDVPERDCRCPQQQKAGYAKCESCSQ